MEIELGDLDLERENIHHNQKFKIIYIFKQSCNKKRKLKFKKYSLSLLLHYAPSPKPTVTVSLKP